VEWIGCNPAVSRFDNGILSREHDTIDYVRASPASQWQAVNLNALLVRSRAASTGCRKVSENQWRGLARGRAEFLEGLQSEYASIIG